MNIPAPPDFIPVTQHELESVLALCNWERDGYSNADVYWEKGPDPRMRVGYHMIDGLFYVNPQFRKFLDQLREKKHATEKPAEDKQTEDKT